MANFLIEEVNISMASAIIETGGKQYHVQPGQVIAVEKLETTAGATITFDRVLMVTDGKKVEVGSPLVKGFTVTGEVIEDEAKGIKIRVFTYKSKKRQRRTLGHRQLFTKVKITDLVSAKAAKATTK